ncbi:hypothetical protein [Pedobacter sp. BAL39]|uniref:hypothetical protein n=1 Tax=Pedobacter sp. BAL39 TaxID=391596 RepID=UPI0012F78EDF|nr:hypothetical protein [Pedobacter sp. BAL39]
MRIQGIIGAVLMAVGGICPLLRVPIMGNWNYFDLDQRLAIAFYVLVVIALLGSLTKKAGLIRFAGWAAVVLVAITFVGIYFKTQGSFGFLHFKGLINRASGLVKYKWGWLPVFAGILALLTVRKPKVIVVNPMPEKPAV